MQGQLQRSTSLDYDKWKTRKNTKNAKNTAQIRVFFSKSEKMEILVVFSITFEPIKIKTRSAHQNDHLNLSLVKHIFVVGKKLARNGHKMAICQSQILVVSLYIMKVQKCKFPTPSLCYFVQCLCVS